jgi:hypothetical protein
MHLRDAIMLSQVILNAVHEGQGVLQRETEIEEWNASPADRWAGCAIATRPSP